MAGLVPAIHAVMLQMRYSAIDERSRPRPRLFLLVFAALNRVDGRDKPAMTRRGSGALRRLQSLKSSLIPVLARVWASTVFTITAQ